MLNFHRECWNPVKKHSKALVFFAVSKQIPIVYSADRGRAEIKHGTNARNPGPKSDTKFCQPNMDTTCINLSVFLEMHITICFHLLYIYISNSIEIRDRVKPFRSAFRPGPLFVVFTMSSIFQFLIDRENIKFIDFIFISVRKKSTRDQPRTMIINLHLALSSLTPSSFCTKDLRK